MRSDAELIVEELRTWARLEAAEFDGPAEEGTGWEAADYIERLRQALRRIEAGEGDPHEIARAALDRQDWIFGNGPKADPV